MGVKTLSIIGAFCPRSSAPLLPLNEKTRQAQRVFCRQCSLKNSDNFYNVRIIVLEDKYQVPSLKFRYNSLRLEVTKMRETYFVKTRNWHCQRWVKRFLDISYLWGVQRGDYYDDGD